MCYDYQDRERQKTQPTPKILETQTYKMPSSLLE